MPLGWSVIKELLAVRRRLDGLLAAIEEDVGLPGSLAPAADLYDTSDAVALILELPGVDPESIELQLAEDRLRVAGRFARCEPSSDATWLRMERRSGAFQHEFGLPAGVVGGQPSTRLERGVLTILLPRAASTGGGPTKDMAS